MELFRKETRLRGLQAIAEAVGKNKTNVANLLAKLLKQRVLGKAGDGLYYLLEGPSVAWQAKGRLSKQRLRGMTREELDAVMHQKIAGLKRLLEKIFYENFQDGGVMHNAVKVVKLWYNAQNN